MNLHNYLQFLSEQSVGLPPQRPVQKPRGPNQQRIPKPKVSKVPKIPMNPQEKKLSERPKRTADQIKNDAFRKKNNSVNKSLNVKTYFNYMVWTSKILKQGEIFRKNCYINNCHQFEVGTGDRRICKDRCDIETCKKVIQMLQVSQSKCAQSQNPDKCKMRYHQLIPLYKNKLNKISNKFMKAAERKKSSEINVG
jgi:hypothetical protein